MSPLDIALPIIGLLAEAILIVPILKRRIYRSAPMFCLFIFWVIPSDLVMNVLSRKLSPSTYMQAYLIEASLDSLFQFAVLVELAWSVLRPIRTELPRRTTFLIIGILLVAGAAMWPVAGWLTIPFPDRQFHTLMQLQQAVSNLRILFVFVLAGFSQLLAIGWRDRELQIASGIGFYSLMSLGGAILHTHHASVKMYHNVDQIVSFSFFCSLLYWIVSFVQQEAPRQEFSPRMESFLLAVSGAARADRAKIEEYRRKPKEKG